MDVFASVALGTEPPQDDIMRNKFVYDKNPLITPEMMR